jgi:hypothetical protein
MGRSVCVLKVAWFTVPMQYAEEVVWGFIED